MFRLIIVRPMCVRRLFQIMLSLAFMIIASSLSAKDRLKTWSSWGTTILGTRVEPINRPDVRVGFITERNGKLIGSCSLANVPDGTYTPVELQIRGEWQGEQFWPAIEYQVGDQYKGPWRTIKGTASPRRSLF
jgi:hypothetical protein